MLVEDNPAFDPSTCTRSGSGPPTGKPAGIVNATVVDVAGAVGGCWPRTTSLSPISRATFCPRPTGGLTDSVKVAPTATEAGMVPVKVGTSMKLAGLELGPTCGSALVPNATLWATRTIRGPAGTLGGNVRVTVCASTRFGAALIPPSNTSVVWPAPARFWPVIVSRSPVRSKPGDRLLMIAGCSTCTWMLGDFCTGRALRTGLVALIRTTEAR